MIYSDNIKPLQNLYKQKGLQDYFINDNEYLSKAFNEINQLWQKNFSQITKVRFMMIAEAPLWGKSKKYAGAIWFAEKEGLFHDPVGGFLQSKLFPHSLHSCRIIIFICPPSDMSGSAI